MREPWAFAGRWPSGARAARSSDRDGAPADAPPDLASLPDPVPQVEPIRQGGPNKPYTVLGQSYEPMVKDVSWKEKGTASWYGTKFHGRRTASGEMFSMYGLTAAHRTLPIPSYARVRHARTGKEIIVRINDRGPFHSSRIIDLSYAAAAKLGILSSGSAPVEVERLTFDDIRSGAWKRDSEPDEQGSDSDSFADAAGAGDTTAVVPFPDVSPVTSSETAAIVALASPSKGAAGTAATAVTPRDKGADGAVLVKASASPAHTPAAKGFWVQLAALAKRDSVDRLQQKVSAVLGELSPMMTVFQEASWFKLQVGPYGSRQEAVAAAEQARDVLQLAPMVVERR
ncbi:MAG: septal ring lytic transglycosylase RlpA family protein [Aquabacterium sp.]